MASVLQTVDSIGDSTQNEKQGFLQKRGEIGLPRWKTRWFHLTSDNQLSYYTDSSKREQKVCLSPSVHSFLQGSIDLFQVKEVTQTAPQYFQVELPGRIYYLYAESAQEGTAWFNAINDRYSSASLEFFVIRLFSVSSTTGPNRMPPRILVRPPAIILLCTRT